MKASRILAFLVLILIGVVSRIIPHPPNFTALNSIALISVFYFNNRLLSLAGIVISILLSDLVIGLHSTMSFIYLSFGLIIFLSHKYKNLLTLKTLPYFSVACSVLFYLISNFGVWMTDGFYPLTFAGLELCYVAALPFLASQVLGDLCYGYVLFGSVELLKKLALRKNSPQVGV